ncbi:ArsA family ATPase [Candidatus Bathyarchaeota archaeon]|nr:ArsA family ATPase [Candidatus Bathyarchaeota archaeon]
MSFREIVSNPKLRHLFFGGKGGVGKTVIAAGAAYYISENLGRRVLLSSTNPVHSLSSCFGKDFWGKGICHVDGTSNLDVIEIDTTKTVEGYKESVRNKIMNFLKTAGITTDPEPFVEAATTNPAFEEAAMFDEMVNILLGEKYDVYIFDTAPVAHTYRLLGMSKVYDLWLRKMVKSREEALSTRLKLSFRKEKILEEIKKDPLLLETLEMRRRTEEAKRLLTDREKTAFFFVTLPLALPIAVIERFIGWVRTFEIPVGGVVMNCVIPEEAVKTSTSPYIVNKLREQAHYIQDACKRFPGMICAYVPLFETEVRDLQMISRVAEALAK